MTSDNWSALIQAVIPEQLSENEQKIVDLQKSTWDGSSKDWLFLPSVTFHGRCLVLVALGREGERRGVEVIRAFFGPKFADSLKLNSRMLANGTQIHMRVAVLQDDEWDRYIKILEKLVKVRIGTRPIERMVAQPLSILLRDFNIAIVTGSDFDAEKIAKRIESTGLLRGDNIEFLRIHRLASFGHWEDIYKSDKFDDLTRTRRSKFVSEHLLRALWMRDFASLDATQMSDTLNSVFKKLGLANKYRDLLGSVAQSSYPEVRTLLALFFGEINDRNRFEILLKALPAVECDRLRLISGLKPEIDLKHDSSGGNFQIGVEHPCVALANCSDHLGVIGYYELHPGDERALGYAIDSALELQDTEAAIRVVRCIDLGLCELPTRRTLLERIDQLRSKASGFCGGWLEWAEKAAVEPWGEVFQSVSANANSWDADWCDNDALSKKFTENLISAFGGPNKVSVQQSVAFVLDLVSSNSERAAISEVRSSALNILVYLEMSNSQIRNAFVSLISSYGEGNISQSAYVELVDAAGELWDTYGSVSSFAWFLDVLDQVLLLPRLDDGKLHQLINKAFHSVNSFGNNLDNSLHSLFCDIAEPILKVNRRDLEVVPLENDNWAKFGGLKIGLYSLLESLPDLRDKIASFCPNAIFVINQDKVASNELRSFAANSDIVLIHTSKAKHAATEELNRYITGQRIYVSGKGRGSIINSLLQWKANDN
jgi:hypothetical protein